LKTALGQMAEIFIQIILTVLQKDFPIILRAFVVCHLISSQISFVDALTT
jgi:hypothetical protein